MQETRRRWSHSFKFESESHCNLVLSGLDHLRKKRLLFDVTLVVDGQRFRAHRVVLASCSDYFRAMFTDAMRERQQEEICLNGVSATGLEHLLEYAYTSRLALNLGNIQAVLSAASHLQILTVVEACSQYLLGQLELDNCVDIITIAETYSLTQLRKHAHVFAARSLPQLACMAEFQRLSLSQLEHLLEGHYPMECPEIDVLHSVLCWLQYESNCTGFNAVKALRHVRLADISTKQLEEFMKSALFTSLESSCPSVRLYINAAVCRKRCNYILSSQIGVVNSRGLEPALVNVGGFHPGGITNAVTYLPKHSSTWYTLTDIPHVEQSNFGMAVLNNELYVIGGCFQTVLQEATHPFGFRYSPLTHKWTSIAPMRLDRSGFCMAASNGKLYVMGGLGDMIDPDDEMPCESYDPEQDTWSDIRSMPGPRDHHAGCAYWGQVFVSGGHEWDEVMASVLAYQVRSDSWEYLPDMPHARADHCMTSHDGMLYVAGGWYEAAMDATRILLSSIDTYDINTRQWQTLTQASVPRYLASLVILDDTLHLIGGFEQSSLDINNDEVNRGTSRIERYSLVSGAWEEELRYPQKIWEHLSCVLYVPTCREDELLPSSHTRESTC